jgi:hypothetical protein
LQFSRCHFSSLTFFVNWKVFCIDYIKDWAIKSVVLQTRAFGERHIAVNLSEILKIAVEDWGLAGRMVACVHDNAANIVLANSRQYVPWQSVPCFAHTLQLGVNDGIATVEIEEVVDACNRLVAHFHRSALATQSLWEKQTSLQMPQHRLIQSCKTRWNSVCDMFGRLNEQRQAVTAVLADRTVTKLKDEEKFALERSQWQIIEDVIPVLHTLKCATTALSGENNVSNSVILPVTHGLLKLHLVVSEDDSRVVAAFKTAVSASLKERLLKCDEISIPVLSAALDPRHKQLKFLAATAHQQVQDKLIELLAMQDRSPT